jgi:putative glutamine amidotransferase
MYRPVIGITAYVEQARWGVWDTMATLVPHAYVRAVTLAGGRALVIPPESVAPDLVELLDGLVLSGGPDVTPDNYGQEPHEETTVVRPDRDQAELAVLHAALDADLPILGVCRGLQLMAVDAGGHLHQHVPDLVGHDAHRPSPGEYGEHDARFAPGSRVAAILGDHLKVNSYHHQSVDDPGRLTVTGWAEDDTIEVAELDDRRFVLGVQWHPEATQDYRLFAALVEAARRPETTPTQPRSEIDRAERETT